MLRISIFKTHLSQRLLILVGFILFLLSCKSTQPIIFEETPPKTEESSAEVKTEPKTEIAEAPLKNFGKAPLEIAEFRAAWIASVANINWPSKPGLSTANQKEEAIKMLDFLQNLNFNAVILQVRPQADALYDSKIEPWSYYLTGENGKAPKPYYDPLEFWIAEAHNRGMELHVWLNPYRAHHSTAKEIGGKSIVKTNPELVMELKNGFWWMDPGNKMVQDHSSAVVQDIVKRYNIDGVHFDDYFYPYASYNGKKDFPDDKSWNSYLKNGGELSKPNWRRKNVNDFIQRVAGEIKAEKPYVKFGISPFGIWRPGFPKGIAGMDQYDELYADAKLWLNKGWIDYFTPQLYWKTSQKEQSFPILLGWWESENVTGRHLWPGINISLEDDDENKGEIASQIFISRGMLPDSPGTVHWNIGSLMKNKALAESIQNGAYQKKTLVPPSSWLNDDKPATPELKIGKESGNFILHWKNREEQTVFRWVLYFKYDNSDWDYTIFNQNENRFTLPKMNSEKQNLEKIGVTAVSRTGNQSNFEEIIIIPQQNQ